MATSSADHSSDGGSGSDGGDGDGEGGGGDGGDGDGGDGIGAAGKSARAALLLRTALRTAGVEEGQVHVAARPAGPLTSETVVFAAAAAGVAGGGAPYDVVVCGEVGEDLPVASQAELTAALASLGSLLAPNGLLVLAERAADVPSSRLHEALQAAQLPPRPASGGASDGGGSSFGARRLQSVALPAPDGDGGLITLAMVSEDQGGDTDWNAE